MSIRAHRIKKIEYAERPLCRTDSAIMDAIQNHGEVASTDNPNQVEITLSGLKDILAHGNLDEDDAESLAQEIGDIEKEGELGDDDFVTFDLF